MIVLKLFSFAIIAFVGIQICATIRYMESEMEEFFRSESGVEPGIFLDMENSAENAPMAERSRADDATDKDEEENKVGNKKVADDEEEEDGNDESEKKKGCTPLKRVLIGFRPVLIRMIYVKF